MKNETTLFDSAELSAVEPSKADMIRATFVPMADMLEGFEAAYSAIITESEKEITSEVTTLGLNKINS